MVTLYCMRHGQSVSNAQGIFAGRAIDTPLTDEGATQAYKAALHLKNSQHDISFIVSSSMTHTNHTADIVATELELNIEYYDPRLQEMDLGTLAGVSRANTHPNIDHELENEGAVNYGGESRTLFDTRIIEAACHYLQLGQGSPLFVAHRFTCSTMQRHFLDETHSGFANAAIIAVQLDENDLAGKCASSYAGFEVEATDL